MTGRLTQVVVGGARRWPAIASVAAAVGGLVLVIATVPYAPDVVVAQPVLAKGSAPAAAMLADPQQKDALVGTIDPPAEPPRSTRTIDVSPHALVGARALTVSGSTIKLYGVGPGPQVERSVQLRVASGESIDIVYDKGTLHCYAPVDAPMRIEEIQVPHDVDDIDYRIGYVRSSWRGGGRVRACLGFSDHAAILPDRVAAKMRFALPREHLPVPENHVPLVSVDGGHAIRCADLDRLRIVTMSELVPENIIGQILIDAKSAVERLERDHKLGVTCATPKSWNHQNLACKVDDDRFECVAR